MGIVGKIVENDTILLFARTCRTNSFQVIAKTKVSIIEYFHREHLCIGLFSSKQLVDTNFVLLNRFSGQQTIL